MITGAHAIIYSRNAEADRNFLRDVLGFPHVDAAQGVACTAPLEERWGTLVRMSLPGFSAGAGLPDCDGLPVCAVVRALIAAYRLR